MAVTVASLAERVDGLALEFRRLRGVVTGNGAAGLVVAVDRNTRWRAAQTWLLGAVVVCLIGVGGKLIASPHPNQTTTTRRAHVIESTYTDQNGFTRTARVDRSEAPADVEVNTWMADELGRREAALLLKWPKA